MTNRRISGIKYLVKNGSTVQWFNGSTLKAIIP